MRSDVTPNADCARPLRQALFVISATDWIVSSIIILPWFGYTLRGLILLLFMHLFAGMSFVCHLRVMFTCPGVRPRGVLSEEELSRYLDRTTFDSGTRVCRHCKTFKTERMHHCRTCNRCVVNMDHHCPWVNNCVGKYNQKFFVLFLFYVSLGEMYATVLLLMRGISCMYESQSCEDTMGSAGPLLGVLALIVSAFFLIFVCTMFCEQFDAIRDGLSEIDRLQHRYVFVSRVTQLNCRSLDDDSTRP